MNTNYLMKKKNFHLFYKVLSSLNHDVLNFKIYFSFSFCSDFNLEATVVKTYKTRDLKQFIWKKNFHNN